MSEDLCIPSLAPHPFGVAVLSISIHRPSAFTLVAQAACSTLSLRAPTTIPKPQFDLRPPILTTPLHCFLTALDRKEGRKKNIIPETQITSYVDIHSLEAIGNVHELIRFAAYCHLAAELLLTRYNCRKSIAAIHDSSTRISDNSFDIPTHTVSCGRLARAISVVKARRRRWPCPTA